MRSAAARSRERARYELVYSTGGHGGPYTGEEAAREAAERLMRGGRDRWIAVVPYTAPQFSEKHAVAVLHRNEGWSGAAEFLSAGRETGTRDLGAVKRPPRVGSRVRFCPNPASLMFYSDPPPIDAVGTVTTMPGMARYGRFLPGPMGGLLYVDWDGFGVMGVSLYDVCPERGGGRRAVEAPARRGPRPAQRRLGLPLHERIARALGWSVEETQQHSLQSLRELVRSVDPVLANEISQEIQSGRYITRGFGAAGRGLEPYPAAGGDIEDVLEPRWIRLTYGKLPDKRAFDARFAEVVGSVDDHYQIHLKGQDAEVAGHCGVDPVRSLDADELYDLLQCLVHHWDDGNEAAGDLASSILQTLNVEWI